MITLTSDFGMKDSFVAEMKGVILGINPQITLVDLCHEISPQNIHEAAFVLHTAYRFFPPGTIHLVAVDPDGGSISRPIAIQTGGYSFVGPDNGVFSYVIAAGEASGEGLTEQTQAVHLTNQRYWRSKISPTFRGRDILAPVAAHLSLHVFLEDLGQPISDLVTHHIPWPEVWSDGTIVAQVLHIDRFGNVITNVTEQMLEHREQVLIEVAGRQFREICRAYLEVGPGELIALIGSNGYLEISERGGSAAAKLGVRAGDLLQIRSV